MSRRRTSARHHSRQVALQVLYAIDLARDPAPSAEEAFARVAAHFDLPSDARAFAKDLVCGTVDVRSQLDTLLAEHTRNWRLSRMAAVDRNILRLACYELTRTDTPVSVVLDEAIELARRFGSDASPGFVNGVLDAVGREVREPDRQPREAS